MADYAAMMKNYSNRLAEERLLLTQWAATAVSQYDALPDDIKAELPTLPGRTAQEMVPALWAETITDTEAKAYQSQIAALNAFVSACNAKVNSINQLEAVRCKLS